MLMVGKINYGKHSEGLRAPHLYVRINVTYFYKFNEKQNALHIFTVCFNNKIILADTRSVCIAKCTYALSHEKFNS